MKPIRVSCPGEILQRELDARGQTQREFAEKIQRPYQAICEIANGKKIITVETALEFEKELGISAEFWLGLETSYRLYLARK